jgi:glycosyltransferase involved in cell wall biosynthesis
VRILLVSAYHPCHGAPSSGPKIVAREVDRLRASGHDVVVVSFENELDRRAFPGGLTEPAPPGRMFRLRRIDRIIGAFRRPDLPFCASARPHVAAAAVRALLKDGGFDAIQVEFIQGLEVIPRAAWDRVTLVAHDVVTQLWDRRVRHVTGWRRALARLELARVRRWERIAFRGVGRLVVLNEKDRDLAAAVSGRGDIGVRYPQVARYVAPGERTAGVVEPGTLLYWGHMARSENVDAVMHFARAIFPRIRAAVPEARLIVAGIDPPDTVRDLAGPQVEVTGFVPDPAPMFRRAALGIVPLRLGAGIKIKTIEMLDAGIPVVATTVGAEGVRSSPLLTVADDDEAFARAVIAGLGRAS